MKYLELLAPAKNAEQGVAAINHGADAVYIGAPLFGARAAAGNSLDDIEKLVRHAHLYNSKVFTTVNTLLFDNELDKANKLIHQLYNIGVDALIVQDMGLLETDLPPIELHASTQTHNISLEKVQFLEKVGFKRVILARETSLEQMRLLRTNTHVELEAFVQGALCVCYSGQCYMSQYLNERSGNRGCCGQPCRSTYDLYTEDTDGMKLLRKEEHLLSLKDFNASQHIATMIDAGITSFKIEGRLKDLSYVKNVTAFYRQLLDSLMEMSHTDADSEPLAPASDGKTSFFFTPDPARTFNRGFTDYFLEGRQKMASMATQKSLGKKIGTVTKIDHNTITIKTQETFTPGDGLCFFNPERRLEGFFVNHVEGNRVSPNRMPENLTTGTTVWRNNDFAFEKQLQGKTSERKINITFILSETSDGFSLTAQDSGELSATASIQCEHFSARDTQKAVEQIEKQLSKLGDTPFSLKAVHTRLTTPRFIPASALNEMRRQAVALLIEQRITSRRPTDKPFSKSNHPYFETHVDYRANIINEKSAQFYRRHGVETMEYGLEKTHDYADKALMTTKYCLRYELGICFKNRTTNCRGNLYLRNNKNLFLLKFDCARCEMQVTLKESSFHSNAK